MVVGVVKWVDLDAGRGRIVQDGECASLPFVLGDVADVGPPAPGQRVEFVRQGDIATEVRLARGSRRQVVRRGEPGARL